MLEMQPDGVVAATLWELEAAVAATLPPGALIKASWPEAGGYNIEALWSSQGAHGNAIQCSLALHFPATQVRMYCGFAHPRRDEVCQRLGEWLRVQVESEAANIPVDIGFDLGITAPAAFFGDDSDAIRVTRQDRKHDFSPYRGPTPPRLA